MLYFIISTTKRLKILPTGYTIYHNTKLIFKGLEDLKNGYARTPLPPDQTFIDDPLRILRAIRFISRFDLEIDPEMAKSFQQTAVLVSLH